MYKFTVIDRKCVIEKLGKGSTILCVDFNSMVVKDCERMTIGAIRALIENMDTIFYAKEEVLDE